MLIAAAAAAGRALTDGASASGGVGHDAARTALASVDRRPVLTQTAQVSGILGYAGTWTVAVTAATPRSVVLQAAQQLATAETELSAAEAQTAGQPAAAGSQALAGARANLAIAHRAAADARSQAASYGDSATFTRLPRPGTVVRRGGALFAINGQPTLLLYGRAAAWRAFRPGMSAGRDVAALNANLRALGDGDVRGDAFTGTTERAIVRLQHAHGLPATGELLLGAVAFEPGAVRVTNLTATAGGPVQAGPVMTVSSTRHDVAIQLDAAQQSEVRAGERVTVTLPDDTATAGVITSVGRVAALPSGAASADSASGPTVEVDVRLVHASARGTLDQAPVDVSITSASVRDVLAVPVNALVALASGGYAVEVVGADGAHRLLAVAPGLFDDAQGLVQVSGKGLRQGQRVVVPGSA